MSNSRARIAFYCQHLLGVGHLTRSFAITNQLVSSFDVEFIQGGPDIGKIPDQSVMVHYLSPLQMKESTAELYDPIDGRDVDAVFADRMKVLQEIAGRRFDFLIVELFPFGRKKFKAEILGFIAEIRRLNPKIQVICSLRDILVEKHDYLVRDKKNADLVNQYFDHVFVHSDPNILKLDQTYSAVNEIEKKISYTGFVTESADIPDHECELMNDSGLPQILISQGGGVVGRELLEGFARIVSALPDYFFLFSMGPNAPKDLRTVLVDIIGNCSNYKIVDFLQNFEAELCASKLSASLAGYNTMMNLLNRKSTALVFPYMANREQNLRATAIEKFGALKILRSDDLKSKKLLEIVKNQISNKYPVFEIELDGTTNTRVLLEKLQK